MIKNSVVLNKSASILPVTVIAIFIIFLLGYATIQMAMLESVDSAKEYTKLRLYYAADSALQEHISRMIYSAQNDKFTLKINGKVIYQQKEEPLKAMDMWVKDTTELNISATTITDELDKIGNIISEGTEYINKVINVSKNTFEYFYDELINLGYKESDFREPSKWVSIVSDVKDLGDKRKKELGEAEEALKKQQKELQDSIDKSFLGQTLNQTSTKYFGEKTFVKNDQKGIFDDDLKPEIIVKIQSCLYDGLGVLTTGRNHLDELLKISKANIDGRTIDGVKLTFSEGSYEIKDVVKPYLFLVTAKSAAMGKNMPEMETKIGCCVYVLQTNVVKTEKQYGIKACQSADFRIVDMVTEIFEYAKPVA